MRSVGHGRDSALYILSVTRKPTKTGNPMRPLALALTFSLAAVSAAAVAGSQPSVSTGPDKNYEERFASNKPADCHRDVRTHRIGGVKITHRHVGDNCQVRPVQKVN
jgi:hypothetical protein